MAESEKNGATAGFPTSAALIVRLDRRVRKTLTNELRDFSLQRHDEEKKERENELRFFAVRQQELSSRSFSLGLRQTLTFENQSLMNVE